MSAMEPLCLLAGINPKKLSKEKRLLLEAEFFARIYKKLEDDFRKRHRSYFDLFRFTLHQEDRLVEEKFAPLFIQTMLSSDNYTLEGVARYTNTPEEVLINIRDGHNPHPSVTLFRRIIELDRMERREFYQTLIKESLEEE